jgi:DNA repair exonuclease SbcCD ATPase subunit
MNPLLESILWLAVLLPAFLFAAALIMILLSSYWQKQTQAGLKEIISRLRKIQTGLQQTYRLGEAYSTDDPEPFGPLAGEMQAILKKAEGHLQDASSSYRQLQENIRSLDWSRLRDRKDLTGIIQLPFNWYFQHQSTRSLLEETKRIEQEVESAENLLQNLANKGKEVAGLARRVLAEVQSALSILAGLRGSGIHDPNLDATTQEARNWEQALHERVPLYFLEGDEDEVSTLTDKNTVIDVYRIVDKARPVGEALEKQATEWEQQRQDLSSLLEKLPLAFRGVQEAMASAEANPAYPVHWDVSRTKLSAARSQVENLGTIQSRRTFEKVKIDQAAAQKLIEQLESMLAYCQQVIQSRQEIAALLEAPDVKQGQEWTRKAIKFAEQTEAYDHENFHRQVSPLRLRQDLDSLAEAHRKMEAHHPEASLSESEISVILEEARLLASLHEEVRPRLGSIQERFVDIQESERNARELTSRTRALLNQAVPLVTSNHYLAEAAGKEAEALREEMESLSDEMEARQRGLVEKKAQKANALARKIEQSTNRWLEKLESDLNDLKRELAERVGVLKQVALLDEPALNEAEEVLGGREVEPAGSQTRRGPLAGIPFSESLGSARRKGREQMALADAVGEMKRLNQEWHRCLSLLHALEDLEGPLLDQNDQITGHAENARLLLDRAQQMVPGERTWPPTTVFIAAEKRQLEGLEKRWEQLKRERLRAIQLIAQLSELSSEFQTLENKIAAAVERAEEEQERVVDLERRLSESMRLWQYQMQIYGGNPQAQDAIQALLEDAESEADSVRQSYMNGSLPYNHVVQHLRSLCQRVEGAQAHLDRDQAIDINGVVQRRSY